jgi:hypothetical protein
MNLRIATVEQLPAASEVEFWMRGRGERAASADS